MALAISALVFYSRWQAAQNDLARAQEAARANDSSREKEIVRSDVSPPQRSAEESEQIQKERIELARLRNEVGELRRQDRDFQQIARQAEYWQQKARELVTENSRLKNGSLAQESADAETQRNICLRNLSDIAAAKQKWAEATQVERGSIANLNEVVPYFRDGKLPFCPSGGNYQINRVGAPPVCSYAGHVLKEQSP